MGDSTMKMIYDILPLVCTLHSYVYLITCGNKAVHNEYHMHVAGLQWCDQDLLKIPFPVLGH